MVAGINERHENQIFLPGVEVPALVRATGQVGEALDRARFVVVVVPSHFFRGVVCDLRPSMPNGAVVISAAKGIEEVTLARMSEVLRAELGEAHPIAVLSGPSFAAEVGRGLPTAVSVASDDLEAAEAVQAEFRGPAFRLYTTTDVVGVEIGAALKNVIAIAAGVVAGLGLGHNTTAALITRGLVEISRLADALGGRRETLSGLAGLGDLVLTCTGHLSRNRQVGIELGQGRRLEDVLAGMKMVAEGVRTTGAAVALGERSGVELPIAEQMARVLGGQIDPLSGLRILMDRPQKNEADPR